MSHAKADPHGRREPDEPKHKWTALDEVAERAQEEQTGSVACLCHRGNVRGLFVTDTEVMSEKVEDGMGVV